MSVEKRKFDDVLVELGEFGRYQIGIYNLICFFEFIAPWQYLVSVFLQGERDHWCKIPEWDSMDCMAYGFNTTIECDLAKKQVGIPWNYTGNGNQTEKAYAKCERYDVTGVEFSPYLDLTGYRTVPCDAGWDFDTSVPGRTINQDFSVVCGLTYQLSLAQSLFFAGTAIGSSTSGYMSDRFGRHFNMFLCLSALILSGTVCAFSVNIWMYMAVRVVIGISTIGMLQSAFVLANEMIGPSKRNVAGNVIWIYFALGYMLLALIAYFIRNWRHLQLVISLVPLSLFIIYAIAPESPRWLLSKGRTNKATKVMRTLAKYNRVEISEKFSLEDIAQDTTHESKKESPVDLFREPLLRLYALNLMCQLAINTVVYYGISLSIDSLGVNMYMAFAIAGAVEIPACIAVVHPIEYWGRRPSYIFYMMLGGISILATIFVPYGPGRAAVAMVAKFAITASFCVVYLQACEIYPTPVRNSLLGISTVCSNMANIVGPFILLLKNVWDPLPFVIFGAMCCIGGAISYQLPETRGKKIPETMEEGVNIGWKGGPRTKKNSKTTGRSSSIQYHKAGEDIGEMI